MSAPSKSPDNVVTFKPARRERAAAPSLEALVREDLARSGLTIADARRVGIEAAGAEELWAALHPKRPERPSDFTAEGLLIPYFDVAGKRLPFVRARKLRGKWSRDDDGAQRYAQPANSLPHLYLPAPAFREWLPRRGGKIAVPVLGITEGEKKALKACLCGLPFVAVGGVDSYRSARHHVALLEEFGWFDLSATEVEVCYDADAYQKLDVNRALRGLSDALRRDAAPRRLRQKRLTAESAGAHTALDDFLAAQPSAATARREYERLEAREDPVSEAFATFNEELAHVKKKTRYYNVAHDTFYESQRKVVEEYARGPAVLDAKGKPFHPIARWFSERPASTEVLDVVYAPGAPARFEAQAGVVLNTWRAGPLAPTPFKRRAQVAPFLEFVEYLTPGLTEAERGWLLDWAAYPLQHPGAKVMSAVLVWSQQTGTGKNTFGRILKACYGERNVFELDGASLTSHFNNWALHQLVIVNEIDQPSYSERAAVMARLKTIITEERVDLERKFLPRENVANHVNLYLNSNKSDALALDEDDRRFFVAQAPDGDAKWSAEQFRTFNAWLEGGGYEAVFGFLLKRDLRRFDPYAAPPRTAAWREMLAGRTSHVDDLVNVLVETPAVALGIENAAGKYERGPQELFTPDQLVGRLRLLAARRGVPLTLTVGVLRSALGRHHVTKRAFEVRRDGRRLVTAYAMFNAGHWGRASTHEWRAHLLKHAPELGG